MSELKSIRIGELKLGNLTMKVHVLNDGQRIIEEQSVIDFVEYLASGEITSENAEQFAKDLATF